MSILENIPKVYSARRYRFHRFLLHEARTGRGSLSLALIIRFAFLLGLIVRFFILKRGLLSSRQWIWAQVFLVVLFVYTTYMTYIRLVKKNIFSSKASILAQVFLDIVLFSILYFITMDIKSYLFIVYFLPIFISISNFYSIGTLIICILTTIAFWATWQGILLAVPSPHVGQEYIGNFLPKVGLLAVVTFAYWFRLKQVWVVYAENERLYNEAQRRNMELASLSEVSQSITSLLDLDQVLSSIIEHAMKLLKAEAGAVLFLDDASDELVFEASGGVAAERIRGLRFPSTEGIAGWVLRERQPQLVLDVSQDPRFYPDIDNITDRATMSLLCVPLEFKRKAIGVIEIMNRIEGDFDKDDLRVLSTLAPAAAIAIENARLFRETRQMVPRLAALQEVGIGLTAASSSLRDLLRMIVKAAVETIPSAERGVLHLVDFTGEILYPEVWFGMNGTSMGKTRMHIGEGVAGYAIEACVPLNVPDTGHDARYVHHPQAGDCCRSLLVAPMVIEEERIGTISVDSTKVRAFSGSDERLLVALAAHAARAIQMARLFKRNQAYLITQEKLAEAIKGLMGYTTLDELFAFAAYEGARIFGAEDCSLFVKDDSATTIHMVASSSIPLTAFPDREVLVSTAPAAGLTAFVAATGQMLCFVGDGFRNHPAYNGTFRGHLDYLASHTCKCLLLGPLEGSDRKIVGVLKLENKAGENGAQGFSEFDKRIFRTFTSFVGIAIERAMLFQRIARSVRESERERLREDLHDAMNMVHALIMLEAERIRELVQAGEYEVAENALDVLWKNARFINFSELGRLLGDLNEPTLADKGLIVALQKHIERIRAPEVSLDIQGQAKLSFRVEHALYRIAQEALGNIAKHAGIDRSQGGRAQASLVFEPDKVILTIMDNGTGFDSETELQRKDALGFSIMKRRARSIDAQLEITSQPGKGTTVCVVAPI